MFPCTGSRVNVNYEQIALWVPYSIRKLQSLTDNYSPAVAVVSMLTTRPWPIRQERIDNSFRVSYASHSSETILDRKESPLSDLHLALALRYYFCMENPWAHVSAHWQRDKYQLLANCFMSWKASLEPDIRESERHLFVTHYCGKRANHSAIAHKNWNYLLCMYIHVVLRVRMSKECINEHPIDLIPA